MFKWRWKLTLGEIITNFDSWIMQGLILVLLYMKNFKFSTRLGFKEKCTYHGIKTLFSHRKFTDSLITYIRSSGGFLIQYGFHGTNMDPIRNKNYDPSLMRNYATITRRYLKKSLNLTQLSKYTRWTIQIESQIHLKLLYVQSNCSCYVTRSS